MSLRSSKDGMTQSSSRNSDSSLAGNASARVPGREDSLPLVA